MGGHGLRAFKKAAVRRQQQPDSSGEGIHLVGRATPCAVLGARCRSPSMLLAAGLTLPGTHS